VFSLVDEPSVGETSGGGQRDKSIEANEALIIQIQPVDFYHLNKLLIEEEGRGSGGR
jgi:hypothetical protein